MELTDEERLKALGEMSADEWQGAEAAFMGKKPALVAQDDGIDTRPIEAAASYPAELWSKPVQGPEAPPKADESGTPDMAPPPPPNYEPPAADARTSRPSASSSFDSERLRMLDAIASGDDEGRLRKAFEEDRRSAAEDRLSEALVGMARGAPVTFTTKMPSRASEESALMSRKDKQNALRMQMMRGQGKSGVPDWYYKNLADSRSEANQIRLLEAQMRQAQDAANRGDKQAQREFDRMKLELQQKKLDVWSKYLGSKRSGKGGAKKDEERTLPVSEVDALADSDLAVEELDRLAAKHGELSMGSASAKAGNAATRLLGLQGTDSAAYAAERRRVAQSVGKILEGGKLAAGDELKYERMLPQPGDPPTLVKQKTDGLKQMLRDFKAKRSRALKSAGYRVGESAPDEPAESFKPVTVKKGEEQYDIDNPEDLEEAKRAGFQVIQ